MNTFHGERSLRERHVLLQPDGTPAIHGLNCPCHTAQHMTADAPAINRTASCVKDAFGSCIPHTTPTWRRHRAERLLQDIHAHWERLAAEAAAI